MIASVNRVFQVLVLCTAVAAAGCVSTPQADLTGSEVVLSQSQTDLRASAAQLREQFGAAGWSASQGGNSFGRLANMLLNGREENPALSPVQLYVARIAPAGADPSAIHASLETDLSTAASLAGTVAIHARAIGDGDSADHSSLASDLGATEDAIAAVSRALDFFDAAIVGVSQRLSSEQISDLQGRHDQLRAEFDRLGDAADAIADRRRAARDGLFS